MMRIRAVAAGLTLLVAGAWPLAGSPGTACATEGPRAALVIDDGSALTELCVTLDAPTVSGTHLVELAHAQHGLAYSLGFGGQAVCMLNGVGTTGGDCFADYPDFWGYWHGDGKGGWTWGSSGAATFDVADGDVEGWVYGSGDSGTTHAPPPTLESDDVCGVPADPQPSTASRPPAAGGSGGGTEGSAAGGPRGSSDGHGTQPTPGQNGGGAHTGPAPPTVTAPGDHHERADLSGPRERAPRSSGALPSPEGGEIRASSSSGGGRAGPPPGLFVAIALATLLGGAGWWRLRPARAHGATNL